MRWPQDLRSRQRIPPEAEPPPDALRLEAKPRARGPDSRRLENVQAEGPRVAIRWRELSVQSPPRVHSQGPVISRGLGHDCEVAHHGSGGTTGSKE
ncbi:hypothetical protein PG997_006779 [Apiospora hydei]|uniref:Uncharacterized protein n=1 Tax=Apiospora hydei TaxID=1337664 RepID=A0ABR1WQ09_9PEZI